MLFIKPRNTDTSLRDVAAGVFGALDVSKWEERYSSNYPPDEHYFAGYCENAEINVHDGDDDRTSDYPFRVSVENASWRKGPGIIAADTESVAKALAAIGFSVFVPIGPWHLLDWDGNGYVV